MDDVVDEADLRLVDGRIEPVAHRGNVYPCLPLLQRNTDLAAGFRIRIRCFCLDPVNIRLDPKPRLAVIKIKQMLRLAQEGGNFYSCRKW